MKIQFGCVIRIKQLADNSDDVIRRPLALNGLVQNQSVQLADASDNPSPNLSECVVRGNIENTK
jgi:hypothetical protein